VCRRIGECRWPATPGRARRRHGSVCTSMGMTLTRKGGRRVVSDICRRLAQGAGVPTSSRRGQRLLLSAAASFVQLSPARPDPKQVEAAPLPLMRSDVDRSAGPLGRPRGVGLVLALARSRAAGLVHRPSSRLDPPAAFLPPRHTPPSRLSRNLACPLARPSTASSHLPDESCQPPTSHRPRPANSLTRALPSLLARSRPFVLGRPDPHQLRVSCRRRPVSRLRSP